MLKNDLKYTFSTKGLALMAIFAALGGVLMLIEFPLFLAPSFYKLDLSEIPVMIGSFILGPIAGVIMEAVKILIKILIKGTSTNYVGDFASFCIGLCFILPASIIYRIKKTKKNAILGMLAGVVCMAVAGAALNYFVMLPFYETAYGFPMDAIIEAGQATPLGNFINSKFSFVVCCVVPFNIFKGILDSVITIIIYKRISNLIKKIIHNE